MPETVSIDSEYAPQARIEAKPERVAAVCEFLESAISVVEVEECSTTWFWDGITENQFGIFDTVPDVAAGSSHRVGGTAERSLAKADEPGPSDALSERIEVLAAKHT